MNEEFTPRNISDPAPPKELSVELKANMELAKVTMDASYLTILQKQVKWHLQRINHPAGLKITDAETLSSQIDLYAEQKKAIKDLEALRQRYVAFPTKVVALINGLFKTVRDNLNLSKAFVGNMIQEKKTADEAEVERVRTEAELQDNSGVASGSEEVADGVSKVQFETPKPELLSNTVVSGTGVKVHSRTALEVTVVDLHKFLKVLTSRQTRLTWLTGSQEDLVTINLSVLKRILKENPTKKKVDGLEIKKVDKVV